MVKINELSLFPQNVNVKEFFSLIDPWYYKLKLDRSKEKKEEIDVATYEVNRKMNFKDFYRFFRKRKGKYLTLNQIAAFCEMERDTLATKINLFFFMKRRKYLLFNKRYLVRVSFNNLGPYMQVYNHHFSYKWYKGVLVC